MAIPDDDRGCESAATDILSLIAEYTPLKRVDGAMSPCARFMHEEDASFSVNAEEGGTTLLRVQVSGDAITFLTNHRGLRTS